MKTRSFRDSFMEKEGVAAGKKAATKNASSRSGAAQYSDEYSDERIVASFSDKALKNNFLAIQNQVPKQSLLPMLKANAYGHGALWAAKLLVGMPNVYGLGVATLAEGEELRRGLGPKYRRTRIVVFAGAMPWSEEKGLFCQENHLTPVIASDEDWVRFLKGGWPGKVSYELKFNTGMNRLGMSTGLAQSIVKALKGKPVEAHPSGILSHLAVAEDPAHRLSTVQRDRFLALRSELSGTFSTAFFHLGNSAAIWNQKQWRLDELGDVVRPGISLYGAPPWSGAPMRDLSPVMQLRARVVMLRRLKVGESLGYGASFKAKEPIHVAILSAGYGDGLSRMLSNQGHVALGGRISRVLGIVSMDLCVVECPQETAVGDWAEFLGEQIDIWAQAGSAGTIPYELLTSVSGRVKRIYGAL